MPGLQTPKRKWRTIYATLLLLSCISSGCLVLFLEDDVRPRGKSASLASKFWYAGDHAPASLTNLPCDIKSIDPRRSFDSPTTSTQNNEYHQRSSHRSSHRLYQIT